MGDGLQVKCRKCGFDHTFLLGMGMMFPTEYREVVEQIRSGAYGIKWQEYMEKHPGAVVDAERELYQCPVCHYLQESYKLAMYNHKHGLPPEDGYWMKEPGSTKAYRFVGNYIHQCPECGKRMHIVNDYFKGIPCPKCGENLEIGKMIRWD